MPYVDHILTVSEAKTKLLDIIRNLKAGHEVVAITRDGVPSAVLLSMRQYEGLVETVELLSDRAAMRSLRRSMKQAKAGKWVSHEAVFGQDDV